jgi:hypothetical protein
VTSRTKWLAGTLMTLGVVSSLFIGGRVGVIGAALSFTAGLGYLGSQFHLKIKAKQMPTSKQVQTLLEADVRKADKEPTEVLVTVKAAHAYSPDAMADNGESPNRKLDLDVFIHAWLVSEAEDTVVIKNCELKIAASDGSISAERIAGDLGGWCLDTDREESDMWDTHIERVREHLVELNASVPLETGQPREGWLHFRVRNISPAEYTSAAMELVVEDSLSVANVGSVTCTRYLSGKEERNELGDPPHISQLEKQTASG